ncbi:sulfur carrier protein ThiS [Paractinoplanes brasiliensis]|uniref:Sulfur carrier protein ThiS n=1 Tax=Paractinoplanes brasiliensis TaxID=52695 RepID=A0A4R6JQV5_9ACTN|nr:sulfur carrier protein ThiS [Actinoplanes brasiliensis]TDO38769.1 sulfur carrier protein ThiS [Actinoplanes brasiliensis]GID26453.1 thiamine biosynthesis protein ThiS [Actinoplanes brasiliensis]
MRLTVNGTAIESDAGTVQALVQTITEARRGVAVAVNGEVVPRSTWVETELADGDRVEVLTAAQGG